jgi:hypothetical protein
VISDLSSATEALQAATAVTRELLEASEGGEIDAAELRERLADVIDALASARGALLHAHLEVERLRARIAELHAEADVRARVVRRGALVFLKETRGVDSGPYCPRCLDEEQRAVPLSRNSPALAVRGRYRCPRCRDFFS